MGTTSTPTCLSCAWTSSSVRAGCGFPRARDEAKREPLAGARVDAVGASPAARLLEQPAATRGAIAVRRSSSVGSTGSARGRSRFRSGRSARVDLGRDRPDERDAIDAVGERAANQLVSKRGMASGPDPEVEVLPAGRLVRQAPSTPGSPTKRGDADRGRSPLRYVELAVSEPIEPGPRSPRGSG